MRTPYRITATDFSDSLKHFLDDCCVLRANTLSSAVCGTPILHVRARLSIHTSVGGGCEGLGPSVWSTVVPYCPGCETKPEAIWCLHFFLRDFSKLPEVWQPQVACLGLKEWAQ